MPRSTSGKWVSRAASTGGGRTYRGQVPINWYMVIVLIVVVGVGSLLYARSEYRTNAVADTTPPTVSTTWFAAYDFDICGTQRQAPASNETTSKKQSFFTPGSGLIVVAPKKNDVAGSNAVLARFVDGYTGMALSATAVTVPGSATAVASTTTTTTTTTPTATTTTTSTAATSATTTTTGAATTTTTAAVATTTTAAPTTTTTAKAAAATSGTSGIQLDAKTTKKSTTKTTKATTTTTTAGNATTTTAATATTTTTVPPTTTTTLPSKTYTNGMTCPKGTKDAGKTGVVVVDYWASAFDTKAKASTVTGNPGTLKFTDNQEITIGFVPAGTKLPRPTGTVVTALLQATGATTSTTISSTTVTITTTSVATTSTPTTASGATSTTAAATTTSG